MKTRVKITHEARANLTDIGEYIATDSPQAALTFIQKLETACLSLSVLPERGVLYGHLHRCLFVGRYRIVYRVDKSLAQLTVYIVAVHHTAQDIQPGQYE